jgi:DNA repair protein RadC
VTCALRGAGELLGVPLLDHVIVARDGHFSFRDSDGWDE